MAEIAPIRPLPTPKKDRTAAERQRRFRKKRKTVTRNAPVTPPTVTTPGVTVLTKVVTDRDGRGVTVVTTVAALALAAVSAGFSITGMTSIFVGSFWPVIGMGMALELGKLSAVAWIGRAGCAVHPARPLKTAVGVMIGVLMALNAIGAYGFLAKAHISHALAGDVAVVGRNADIEARPSVHAWGLAASKRPT